MRLKKGIYQHFKGKRYELIGVGRDCETLEEVVIYRGLYDDPDYGKNPIWVRPKTSFLQKVKVGKRLVPRFKFVEP